MSDAEIDALMQYNKKTLITLYLTAKHKADLYDRLSSDLAEELQMLLRKRKICIKNL